MNKGMWFIGLMCILSLIVLWYRHSQKKFKLSFWKVCLLGLISLILFAVYSNWLTIRSYVSYMRSMQKVEKAEETIRNSQRETLFAELEKLEDGKDTKSLPRIKEIKTELANLNPQPKQPEKRERIVREFDIPAGSGKNEEKNIFVTELEYSTRDYLKYKVLEGGPVLVRIDKPSAKNDRIIITKFYTAEAYYPDILQFIRWKKTKVRVEIIPRT